MSTSARSYHHGDLRATLISTAVDMLEAGEPYSMRAVARRADVSATAPYRHFADRSALDSAIAVEGFKDLRSALTTTLESAPATAGPVDILGDLGTTYVSFALRRPAVFRLMFGGECDAENSDRVQAAQALHHLLGDVIAHVFPGKTTPGLPMALWSLAHGMAFLHLDGKYRPEPAEDVADRVQTAVGAMFALNSSSE